MPEEIDQVERDVVTQESYEQMWDLFDEENEKDSAVSFWDSQEYVDPEEPLSGVVESEFDVFEEYR